MSDRMSKILEAGEENRQADIELGRQLERARILAIFEGMEPLPDDWNHWDEIGSVIAIIKAEN